MKRFALAFLASLLLTTGTVAAQHRHHHGHHHHHYRNHWVGPAIGGLIIGAAVASSYAYQAPVVISSPPVYIPPQVQPTYYDCLVQVYDPVTNTYRNEVRTCVR